MAKVKRAIWLHTQPEHYFNRMMDALALEGQKDGVKYVAGFLGRGAGVYKEVPVPGMAEVIFLRRQVEEGKGRGGFLGAWRRAFGKVHLDWRRDLLGERPDAIIVSGYAGRTERAVLRECKRRGIATAMFSDSNLRSQRGRGFTARMKRRLKRWWLRGVIADSDLLLTANGLGVAYWRYYGAAPKKILRCAYYADYERIEAVRESVRREALEGLGVDHSRKVIVTAARLVPVKGLELMIRAFKEAGLGNRGWMYVLAGTGPLEGELKALAGEALGKSILFLGFVQPRELLGLIRHAALFVLPSVYEPHGIVIQEALAAGTPVLASDVCGAAYDLVRPGLNGWVFRSGDEKDLLEKLREATGDEDRLLAMRGAARGGFEEWFAKTNPVRIVEEWVRRLGV